MAFMAAKSKIIQNRAFQTTESTDLNAWKQTKTVDTTYNKIPFMAYLERHSKTISLQTKAFTC